MSLKSGHKCKQNIFIISEYVDPQINSTGYYWSKIINGISAAFTRVAVICPEHNNTKKYPFETNRVSIFPITQSSYKKNKLLLRALGLLILTGRFLFKILLKVRKKDLIFCGTNPIFLILCIAITKKVIGFKWVLLVHDVFPDNLAAAEILKKNHPFYCLLDSFFTWAYKSADALIVIGKDMEGLLRKKQITSQLIYQPNWVNKNDISPINKRQSVLIQKLGLENKVVFQFFGNAGRLQGIGNLLNAIKYVTNSQAAFIFIGDGSEFYTIYDFARAHPELPISIVHNSDLTSVEDSLAACDVCFVSMRAGMAGIGVPSKSYFSLAADRPILGVVDINSEIALTILENEGVGWHCEPNNPQKLAATIDKICTLNLSLNAGKARALMEREFDEVLAVERYIKTLKAVMSSNY